MILHQEKKRKNKCQLKVRSLNYYKMNIIKKNIDSLNRLCKKYKVSKLYVFGSLAKGNFTDKSDIDFLVSFKNIPLLKYADNYFDFMFSLEDLFNRNIDLVTEKSLSNPYFIESVEESKQLVYEA